MILEQPCPLVVNTKKLFLLSIFSALRAKLSVPAALVLFGILGVRCCQRYCVVTSEFALHFGTCKKKNSWWVTFLNLYLQEFFLCIIPCA